MKFVYIDESGIDAEKTFAVMSGVIVDAYRMHITKNDWGKLLSSLSRYLGVTVDEIHTRDIYPGNGIWRNIDGPKRAAIFNVILDWFNERKHEIVFSAVNKDIFNKDFTKEPFSNDIGTLWRFLALHISLSVQKYHKPIRGNKGNTVLIFDEQNRERDNFTELIFKPPDWTDTYYKRGIRENKLNQIIDVPYFGNSKFVWLIQLADFVCFFLRRYIELTMGEKPDYDNETDLISNWATIILNNSVPKNMIYLSRGRCDCADLFYRYAPSCLL